MSSTAVPIAGRFPITQDDPSAKKKDKKKGVPTRATLTEKLGFQPRLQRVGGVLCVILGGNSKTRENALRTFLEEGLLPPVIPVTEMPDNLLKAELELLLASRLFWFRVDNRVYCMPCPRNSGHQLITARLQQVGLVGDDAKWLCDQNGI